MRIALAFCAAALIASIAAPLGSAQPVSAHPVPSLTPKATQKLWKKLVRRGPVRHQAAVSGCRALRAVFYTDSDWLRLATKLAANPPPCAQYYISIPPLAADKTAFRYDQPWRIRALGPQFHVLAEINYTGWSNWVTANSSSFYAAGVEARRRLAAQGFDVASGDSWVVNEFSSAVRGGTNVARQKVRDLVRGLYDGDGTGPKVKGAVYNIGIGQSTGDLSSYKLALQNWYLDSPFWQDMSAYVSDWSQELYGDARDYAVGGATVADRVAHLNDYLEHEVALADSAPAEAGAAKSFLDSTYSPLANAAWVYDSGFGFTDIPLAQMQDYVSAQVDALRSFDASRGASDHFGFAWAPRMVGNVAWTADFTTQTGQLLDRLALAIHDSAASPDAACVGTCTAAIAGASFVEGWKTFTSWAYPALGFTTGAQTLTAGAVSQPLTVQLQQAGVVQAATAPATLQLASSSPAGSFATSPSGPWSSTLSVAVPAGGSAASVYYLDTKAGTATITASMSGRSSATQLETVAAGSIASLSVSPSNAALTLGATQTFVAAGADAFGNAVTPAVTWAATGGSLSTMSGASTAFTASAVGTATLTASASGLSTAASITVTAKPAHISSIQLSWRSSSLVVTVTTNAPNATVALNVLRSSSVFAAKTVTTAANGVATLTVGAPRGCYSVTVTSLAATGYQWDGTTPGNARCL